MSVESSATLRCGRCRARPPRFDWLECYGPYDGGLDRLIGAFKFDGHYFLAGPLASLLSSAIGRRDATVDVVAAVPMSPRRERARGYNQAELLGRELAKILDRPFQRSLLSRARSTRTQSELPRDQRAANVRGAFVARPCKGTRVLLVDDICTTGETLRSCAAALKKEGAESVYAACVARA